MPAIATILKHEEQRKGLGAPTLITVVNIVKHGFYRDSVQLMQLSEEGRKLKGVKDVALVSGTELNKGFLKKSGLLTEEGSKADANDTIIAIACEAQDINATVTAVEQLLAKQVGGELVYHDLESALRDYSDLNVAAISVPGQYAKDLALNFIAREINPFIFSNHVPLEDELEIKAKAKEKGLLAMGPEAGTAIIKGFGLGFSNKVRSGPVGVIGSTGTGIQETSILLHNMGTGISHALGVGARDLTNEVGGIMTFEAIKALEEDSRTQILVLVSKPVSPAVRQKLLKYIEDSTTKKFVLCFLGSDENGAFSNRISFSPTLYHAALNATRLTSEESYRKEKSRLKEEIKSAESLAENLNRTLRPEQRYVRGLFAGGALCHESIFLLQRELQRVYSNVSADPSYALGYSSLSTEHTCLDFGSEEFTSGRPHPIIDSRLRNERLLTEARDRGVCAILFDLITGYGASENPVLSQREAILSTNKIAGNTSTQLPLVAHVCGTPGDPQGDQAGKLLELGVCVFSCNAMATLFALSLAKRSASAMWTLASKYLVVGGDSDV